jgi:hypothetical protein
MNDLYDIIDTVLLKHHIIDVIGIATPGIIKDNQHHPLMVEIKILKMNLKRNIISMSLFIIMLMRR